MEGSNTRRWGTMLAVMIIAGVVYWFWHGRGMNGSSAPTVGQGPQGPNGTRHSRFGDALAPIQAATATEQAAPRYLTGPGVMTTTNTVTVHSWADGQLLSLRFQEGRQVKAGDLLVQIDPGQFKVTLTRAQSQLTEDNAILANARRDLIHCRQLVKTNLVSRQELDTQQPLMVESTGTVKADEAVVVSAQLQLDRTRITTPIDSRVSLKQVGIDNQISNRDTTGIAVLAQTHPIDTVFTPPENSTTTVARVQRAGKVLSIEAWDRTNKQKISIDELLSLDSQIDATTGTIKLRAHFSSLDDALFPSQFVNVHLLADTEKNMVVIPVAAPQMGSKRHFVWVPDGENKVSKHSATPGIQDGQEVVISAGLSTGDCVVTNGIDRLTGGAKVEVVTASGSE